MDASTLKQTLDSIDHTSFSNEAERKEILNSLESLHRRLESPYDTARRIAGCEPVMFAIIRMGVDVKLFHYLIEGGDEPKTTEYLANRCGVDVELMGRILRFMAGNFYVIEKGEHLYAPTRFCHSVTIPAVESVYFSRWETAMPTITRLPAFFKEIGYKNPNMATHNPFKFARQSDLDFFQWLNKNPETLKHFQNFIGGYGRVSGRPSFVSWYPIKERLIDGYDEKKGTPFIVDMGGGRGYDMELVLEKCPEVPGKVIVQDQAEVIEHTHPDNANIQTMAHDFFTPQPVVGARAYYLHSIFHDWQDWQSIDILTTLKPALTPNYSKVLIHDSMMPEANANAGTTSIDWIMLCNFGSLVRTESQWRRMVADAGYRVNGIWTNVGPHSGSIIEAEPI